jgi:hypothetical protein
VTSSRSSDAKQDKCGTRPRDSAPEGERGAQSDGDGTSPKPSIGTAAAPRQRREKLLPTTPECRLSRVTNLRLGEPDPATPRELVRSVRELSPYRQVSATSIGKALLHHGCSVARSRFWKRSRRPYNRAAESVYSARTCFALYGCKAQVAQFHRPRQQKRPVVEDNAGLTSRGSRQHVSRSTKH